MTQSANDSSDSGRAYGSHDPKVLCVVVLTQSVNDSRDPGWAYGSCDPEGLW